MKMSNLSLRSKIIFGSCCILVLLVALGLMSYSNIGSLLKSNHWVDHTHTVIQEAMKVEASAVDMETGMRGFLLAGKEEFLGPYTQGEKRFHEILGALKKTVDDNPAQVQLLGEIEQTIDEWDEAVIHQMIELRREIGDAETMNDMAKLIGEAKGKVYFDKFRGQIATFIDREKKLMDERREASKKATEENEVHLQKLVELSKWVEHTYNVIATANSILASAVDMETGMRGFLLAGKEEFLEPYNGGKKRFNELVASLSETVNDNPQQVALLGEAKETIGQWQEKVTELSIELRRAVSMGSGKTMNDVAALVSEEKGKVYFDKFRGQIQTFIDREAKLLDTRREEANAETASVAENRKLIEETNKWVIHTYDVIRTAESILASAVDMETGVRGFLLAGKEEFLEPYNNGNNQFNEFVASLSKTVDDNPQQVALLGEIKDTIGQWQQNVVDAELALRRKIGDAKTMDDMAHLVAQAKGKVYFDKFREQIKTFKGREEMLMASRQAAAQKTASNSTWMIVGGILLGIVLALLISFILARSVTRPFKQIFQGLKTFSNRELDGVGKEFREVIANLKNGSTYVSEASEQIAQGASEQASGLEETSSSLEEMSSMTRSNADNSKQANVLMKNVNEVVNEANTSMSNLTVSMGEISSASEETQKIVKTIDEIAFQTNLLALNAAVEAARAGEAGAGFAVVADEVRNLAMRAAEAAKNTANLIENTVKRVKDGSDLVSKTNEAFTQVAENSVKVGDLMGEVSASSEEQAEGINQIKNAVFEMDKVVQSNAASTEQLSSQSEELSNMVGILMAIVEGNSGNGERRGNAAVQAKGKVNKRAQALLPNRTSTGAVKGGKSGGLRPEEVIPLDDEAGFKEF